MRQSVAQRATLAQEFVQNIDSRGLQAQLALPDKFPLGLPVVAVLSEGPNNETQTVSGTVAGYGWSANVGDLDVNSAQGLVIVKVDSGQEYRGPAGDFVSQVLVHPDCLRGVNDLDEAGVVGLRKGAELRAEVKIHHTVAPDAFSASTEATLTEVIHHLRDEALGTTEVVPEVLPAEVFLRELTGMTPPPDVPWSQGGIDMKENNRRFDLGLHAAEEIRHLSRINPNLMIRTNW